MKKIFIIGSFLLLLLFSNRIFPIQWESCNNGLFIGDANCFLTVGGKLFVGTNNGVFLSTDFGENWISKNKGLEWDYNTNFNITCLATNGYRIYAGTIGKGIMVSDDNGDTWQSLGFTSIGSGAIKTIVLNGYNIFVVSEGDYIYWSTNLGTTWDETGLYNVNKALAAINNKVIVCSQDGIMVSLDNGVHWQPKTGDSSIKGVFTFAVDGKDLYAGTYSGVYVSTNYGDTWRAINKGISNQIISTILISENNIFAGYDDVFVRSTDKGTTWTKIDSGFVHKTFNCLASIGNHLFVGTGMGGVFVSTDSGTVWFQKNKGQAYTSVYSVAADGSNIYAATYGGGIFYSSDNGSSWFSKYEGLRNTNVNTVALKGNKIFAGTDDGLYISTDTCKTWKKKNAGLTKPVQSYKFIGKNIYVGTYNGVFLSTDEGETWVSKTNNLNHCCINSFDIKDSNIIVGGQGSGIWKSTNDGQSWYVKDDRYFFAEYYYTIFIKDSLALGGASTSGIYRSTDMGEFWTRYDDGIQFGYVRTFLQIDSVIFAGTLEGVWATTDGGLTWMMKNLGFGASCDIRSLVSNGEYIFAGLSESGIYRAKIKDLMTAVLYNNQPQNNISCYPNPVQNFINVHFAKEYTSVSRIRIFNILGMQVIESEIPAGLKDCKIELKGIQPGIFFLHLQNGSNSECRKFIVNE